MLAEKARGRTIGRLGRRVGLRVGLAACVLAAAAGAVFAAGPTVPKPPVLRFVAAVDTYSISITSCSANRSGASSNYFPTVAGTSNDTLDPITYSFSSGTNTSGSPPVRNGQGFTINAGKLNGPTIPFSVTVTQVTSQGTISDTHVCS